MIRTVPGCAQPLVAAGRRRVFESRDPNRGKIDKGVLTTYLKARRVPHELEVTWVRGSADPQLWDTGCLAGAMAWLLGPETEHAYLVRYGDAVTLIDA